MKRMKRIAAAAMVALALAATVHAQAAPDAAELTKLLHDFLAGASRNDAAMHDRFWAADLIYTGSSGRRASKADILRDVRSAAAPKPGEPVTVFSAEDVRIQQYGDTAVVAFRLVGATQRDGSTQVSHYLNSGIFLKRDGQWRAVNWQATRLPRAEEEMRKEVAAAEAAFFQALLAADTRKLEAATDESFLWTHRGGEQQPRKQLLEELGSGRLKYSRLETRNVTVAVYGDAAVVRGVYLRQRSATPATPGAPDPAPLDTFYTLTLAYQGGAWRAVAIHTSRP